MPYTHCWVQEFTQVVAREPLEYCRSMFLLGLCAHIRPVAKTKKIICRQWEAKKGAWALPTPWTKTLKPFAYLQNIVLKGFL